MAEPLNVETTAGTVSGVTSDGVVRFRGIPYAAPPVGELRWRSPRPPIPWDGVLHAASFGASPPQLVGGGAAGIGGITETSEDCLTINVTIPASGADSAEGRALRPVVVYIYGGSYSGGSSAATLYDGGRLSVAGDLVYVSFNYRLGALGALDLSRYSTAERPIESNLTVRDQVAALEWVRDNIAAFGGDPARVTIMGQSAGGTAVCTLMATPAARGLFARAIAISPAPSAVYSAERSRGWAERFTTILRAQRAGADAADTRTSLLAATVDELVAATEELVTTEPDLTPGTLSLGPVVDGDYLPMAPLDAFAAGKQHPVPLLIGTCALEGSLFARFTNILATDRRRIDRMFELTDPDARARVIAEYPGYPRRRAAVELGGDIAFWYPSVQVAEAHSAVAPVWMYRYDYAPPLPRLIGLGATHGTDLFPLFGELGIRPMPLMTALGGRAALQSLSALMQHNWASFIRDGVPAAMTSDAWPVYTPGSRTTAIIDAGGITLANDPRGSRRRAWSGYRNYR